MGTVVPNHPHGTSGDRGTVWKDAPALLSGPSPRRQRRPPGGRLGGRQGSKGKPHIQTPLHPLPHPRCLPLG